jgi:cytochrome c nitrite reductase small subunit
MNRRRFALLLFSALLGAVLGLGLFVFWYAEGGSYFSNNPQTCANCHIMRDAYGSWSRSGHHHVAVCNDCHTPHDFFGKWLTKAENGFWHSKGFTLQDFHEPIRITPRNARILQASCVSCHQDLVENMVGHGQSEASCVHCHLDVGHGPPR